MRAPSVVALVVALGVVLVINACGHPATPPAVVVAPTPPPPPPAEITCGDAGVILRGHVEDQKLAGPAKEAAIASACLHDAWPAELLRCVGSQTRARHCLDGLTAEQKASLDDKLVVWNEGFPEEMLDDGTDQLREADADDDIDCSDAVHDVELLAPAVTAAGDERDLVMSLREHAAMVLCDDGWSNAARACFRDAKPGGLEPCRARLEPVQQKALTDKLAELDQLAARIAAVKQKPASFECRGVVAAHYADQAWQGKLGALKGAERVKVIAGSRAKMLRSCIDDKWSATARACVIAAGGDTCFTSHRLVVWGFPAPGIVMKTGIAECDAYGAVVTALGKCDQLPQASRDSQLSSFTQMNQGWVNLPLDERKSAASGCKQASESLRQLAVSVGCKL